MAFAKENADNLSLVVLSKCTGMFGNAEANFEIGDPVNASRVASLVQEIHRSPSNYIESSGEEPERLRVLLAGTTIFRHVLNHPQYSKPFVANLIEISASLEPLLDEIKNGELLT